MLSYRVDDMSCGHCVSTITKAVRAVDAGARVQADLGRHLVQVEPTEADAAEIAEAISEAGYTPVALADEPAATPKAAGGCCGCGS